MESVYFQEALSLSDIFSLSKTKEMEVYNMRLKVS